MYYLIFSCFLALVFGAVAFRRYSKKSCLYLTIAVALFWSIVNYCWALPVLTPWYFHAPWVEFFFTSVMGLGVYYASRSIESDYLGYGQDGMKYWLSSRCEREHGLYRVSNGEAGAFTLFDPDGYEEYYADNVRPILVVMNIDVETFA